MSLLREVLALVTLAGGVFLVVVAGIGILRLPDVYCRSHAMGKPMTLGTMLLVLGYGLSVPAAPWFKLILLLVFQLVTIPVASHLFCLIAFQKGVKRWKADEEPEEAGRLEEEGTSPR